MIIFEMLMPNHAMGKYHQILKWEMTADSTHAVINSYASVEMEFISWQDTYTIPLEWPVRSIEDIEYILTQVGAPMAGGSIVPDTVVTVQCAQARKWAAVKVDRDRRINGAFVTSHGAIQIDDKSFLALSAARRILLTADASVMWTMADNSTVSLTSADIDVMLTEVVQFQTDVHAASQRLRLAIYADEISIGEVEAIDVEGYGWPSARTI
ncbi:DUF4376 domain-containing protein [Novosphingobium sp. FGD1]|uniref:DUF4376 domain-containing protein n=1 Tax=Novosphingobium silvae TaxID=2692619 RepID=A0A7X4GHF6_9SPHN|nr:DUF4376 domain-containing protein [Novosphingobium silvae]MYL98390.1 DUF4376 domain-containing protein [Novosphingobium silvae]